MSFPQALVITLLVAACTLPGAAEELPTVKGRIATTKDQLAAARAALGDHGCLAIRSAARWKAALAQLVALGWKPTAEESFQKGVDFDKQMLVLVYKNGDERDEFAVRQFEERDDKLPALEIVMSYIIYKARAEVVERCNFLVAIVPRTPKLALNVSTYHPQNGGPYPTPEEALLEWQGLVGAESGDVVDSLRGKIEAKETKVKAGQDILVAFTLQRDAGDQVKSGRFAGEREAVFVWVGMYSNGYRNHSFEVRTPEGVTHVLQPKEILNWYKNSPHPVAIKAGQPYTLPEWQTGKHHKSLAALGLDTSRVGVYTITGIYTQAAGTTKHNGVEHSLWGGAIATNTITVEVTER